MNISRFISQFPEAVKTPTVVELPEIINFQYEENQKLKDKISRLKGEKGKPGIKPSKPEKPAKPGSKSNVSSMSFILLSVRSEDQFLSYEVFSDKKCMRSGH